MGENVETKTIGSRIADVVVLIITLAILVAGFLAWKVYQAGPARNAYEVSAGIFEETNKDLEKARQESEKYLENCAERSGAEEACAALTQAYESTNFPPIERLSRLATQEEYLEQAAVIGEQTTQAAQAVDTIRTNTETVRQGIYTKLEPVRIPMFELVKNAKSEIDASQHVVDERQGKVDQSVLDATQSAIDNVQVLVDKAYALDSENPDDYTALTGQLKEAIEQLTNWNIKLRLA